MRWSDSVMRTGNEIQLSNVMGIRQIVKQGLHRTGVLRMHPVRSQFSHRRQDKAPLMKTGMRNGESRGLDDPLSIEQQIQINGAGGVLHHIVTPEAPFRFLTNVQHVFRREVGVKTNDTIIKPRVILTGFHVDGFGLVIRRDAGERGMRQQSHQRHGPVTKFLPVALV